MERYLFVDKQDLETKSLAEIQPHKCLWKDVTPVLEEDDQYIFPLADGDWPQPGTGERSLKMKERKELRSKARKEKIAAASSR